MKNVASLAVSVVGTTSLVLGQCETALLAPNNGLVQDSFGHSVAVDGSVLIVTATQTGGLANHGRVHFFERTGPTWTEVHAEAPAFPYDAFDTFGWDAAVSGETAVVTFPTADTPAGVNVGQVHVYERLAGSWTETQVLRASDGEASDAFGIAVDIDGDTLVIGARNDDDNGESAGSAYVFERSPTGWVQRAKLLPAVGSMWGLFGDTVAIDGDTIAIGALSDIAGENTGAVHIFERTPSGWAETAALVASDPVVFNGFGNQVSLDGDVLLASLALNGASNLTTGVVYVLERSGGVWTETAKLEHNVDDFGDRFGIRHAVSGDQVVISAPLTDNPGGHQNSGAAYLFRRTATGWSQLTQLRPSNLGETGGFGNAVAIDGDTVVLGAPSAAAPLFVGWTYVFQAPSFATAYGFCAVGAPCGNEDPVGGCRSSAAEGAVIRACGSASVAADDLIVTVSRLPINRWGIVYMGPEAIEVPFGDGFRLVGAGATGTFRYDEQFGGTERRIHYGPGLVAFSQTSFPVAGQITAGSTWRFQGWYRDPHGPCGGGFNLSHGVAIEFAP